MKEEKRKAKRAKKRAAVTITMIAQDEVLEGCKIFHQTTKDISLTGIRIQCAKFIPLNSMLRIELALGTPLKSVTAHGRVRWIKSLFGDELFEMGIEFVDTSQEIIHILKENIEHIMD